METKEIRVHLMSERVISMTWQERVGERLLTKLLAAKAHIYNQKKEELIEILSTYNTILIKYKYPVKQLEEEKEKLIGILKTTPEEIKREQKLYHLPVCYDGKLGWDTEVIMKHKKIDKETLIQLHTDSVYTVYFIGFLPGFPYLSGLSEKLFISRKKQPRKEIPKGAVGIGGEQTGIYPIASPGGWQIIGNCPVPLFDLKWELPTLLQPADKLKFSSVSLEEYEDIQEKVKNNSYQLNHEVWE
ncbi:MAG TPA: 5-oxoprolinase subunit PxpB [Chitinophagaceae bacterium]|nr:5-oxoprolinase subunit PxpB [Chitinophagaceae bacterium]